MTRGPGWWELAGAGLAVGGTAVWALGWAARVGILRLLLELFPRSAWDGATWVLVPGLLLLPPVAVGLALAYLAGGRPATAVRAIAGGLAGTIAAGALLGTAVLLVARRLPPPAAAHLARAVPGIAAPVFGVLLVAGWLVVAGRLFAIRPLRGAAPLPAAAVLVAAAWLLAPGRVRAAAYVLDRPELGGLLAAVSLGGALGSAWAIVLGRRDDTMPWGPRVLRRRGSA
jgi:hypothetical protein